VAAPAVDAAAKIYAHHMNTARYVGNGAFEVLDTEAPPPAPGEVQLEVAYTGICGTDLHILHGAMDARVRIPAVLGHEMAGVVGATGDGVEGWSPGDAATVMPLVSCGSCPACTSGASHICYRLVFLGIDAPGSMQSRWNVPADVLVRLPESLSLQTAALAEPTAVAVHDVRRSGLARGEHAVVIGAGPIGLLIANVARAAGAEIAVVEPNELRRTIVESLGLVAVDPLADDTSAWTDDWTGGAGADVAFEVSGTAGGMASAIGCLGARGRAVVVGIHSTPPPVDLFRVFWRELTLIGARVYERPDYEEAVRLLATDAIPSSTLITDVVPLDDIDEAFRAMDAGESMKILLDCGS
jgi:(R,R)-butanediol dehydrogenase / meso-butanediol dehydrogenase / diacetyl reductase